MSSTFFNKNQNFIKSLYTYNYLWKVYLLEKELPENKNSIISIVLHAKNAYYYSLIVNSKEPILINYDKVFDYVSQYTESKKNQKNIRDYLKQYKSFILFVKEDRLVELEEIPEEKAEVKQRIFDDSMKKNLEKQIKTNKKKIKKEKFHDLYQTFGKSKM